MIRLCWMVFLIAAIANRGGAQTLPPARADLATSAALRVMGGATTRVHRKDAHGHHHDHEHEHDHSHA